MPDKMPGWVESLNEDDEGKCNKCGEPIYWAKTTKGKNCPMTKVEDIVTDEVSFESHFDHCQES